MPTRHPPTSQAFKDYLQSRREIGVLVLDMPSRKPNILTPRLADLENAICRSCIVLMSSHFERYIEDLVVDFIDALNASPIPVSKLPDSLAIRQIETSIKTIADIKDRGKKLQALQDLDNHHSWFWGDQASVCNTLQGDPLISSFDNPLPNRVRDLFRNFDISDAVGMAISKDTRSNRGVIEALVKELVEKRNAIAHTGMTVSVTKQQVMDYFDSVYRLAFGIDWVVGERIEQLIGHWPW